MKSASNFENAEVRLGEDTSICTTDRASTDKIDAARSDLINKDQTNERRTTTIFKILLTGVEPAYQVAHPGEKDHTNVDRAAWISTFEEALAKAIVQIVPFTPSREAETFRSQARG
jgi:hypothetical protein